MNMVQINSGNFGSTGNIMLQIAQKAREAGYTVYTAYPDSRDNRKKQVADQLLIGDRYGRNMHRLLAHYTGLEGCFSRNATRRFLRELTKRKIDTVHLHNLHGAYLNLPMLFRYIKKNHIRVIWTLHDCWSFTGHCPHFEMAGCEKWKNTCGHCPLYREYPASAVDSACVMHRNKKKWFAGVEDLTLVTPSQWLADLAKQSFLKEYPVKVIHNGIDLSVFHPVQNDFREQHRLEGKHILLGVAFGWEKRKGLDVFVELARRLGKDYQIVLVGTDDTVDQQLPADIISIHRTQNQQELAQLYTAADLFVNPTREENYPTVNMEAIACGTPVITFQTGGSPEIIDETCGMAVPKDDIDTLEQEIIRICKERPFSEEACFARARAFDQADRFQEYVDLYQKEETL